MVVVQGDLGFEFHDLEPYIDSKTMEVHYLGHHKTYIDNLNKLVEGIEFRDMHDLIRRNISDVVNFNAGGHFNHTFFWSILRKNVSLNGRIQELIDRDFGSFSNFKDEFIKNALSLMGSGWTWLVVENGKLKVVNSKNQEIPSQQKLLVVDMWEHAYYLKCQNRKKEYLENFFHVINWNKVNENI